MDRLDDNAIERRLANLPDWRREGDEIKRTIITRDFRSAIALVDAIADQAEALDHHPDIDIRYRTLHLTLSTHSAGGLTEADFTLAARIDSLAAGHD